MESVSRKILYIAISTYRYLMQDYIYVDIDIHIIYLYDRWIDGWGPMKLGCILHPVYKIYTVGSNLSVSLLIDENDPSVLSPWAGPPRVTTFV